MARTSARRTALALVAALLLGACGDDDASTATDDPVVEETSTTTPQAAETEDATATTTTTTAAPEPEGTTIEVTVTGGQVEGGGRTPVPLGDDVTIRVTSDVDDHVHLHGYDVLVDVTAGATAELTFTADIPGVFEVELEESRIALLELEVS